MISAIAGTAGVGKAALAVHLAHELVPCFPDVQLFVNLHGYDALQRLSSGEVLRRPKLQSVISLEESLALDAELRRVAEVVADPDVLSGSSAIPTTTTWWHWPERPGSTPW